MRYTVARFHRSCLSTFIAVALGLSMGGCEDDSTSDGGGDGGLDETSGSPTGGDGDGEMSACPTEVFLDVSQAPGAGAGYPDPFLDVSCTDTELVVLSNGIPHYTFVPMTPNALVEVNHEYRITRTPELAAAPTDIPLLGLVGFAINGMPFFGPNEGPMPDPFGDPIFNQIMDECLGHTAAEYHYHALLQQCLRDAGLVAEPWLTPEVDASVPSPVLGFAYDGFPIYGSYACVDEACSSVAEMRSGWVQIGDPSTYAWDAHEYVASEDPTILDRCNGHVGPDGTYHYHATATFPYILGCFSGTPAEGAGQDGGGGGNPGDPPPCAPGQTSMCCGDGVCDGPETADNCAEDCG